MTGTRVEVVDASKTIDGSILLHPVTFTVDAGSCVVLRGPNGAGKTTALRLVAGLAAPSTGSVTLDGEPADERRPRTREAVAALLGTPAGWRDLTLVDHLTLVDASWGRDPDTCRERVFAALEEMGIGHLPDRFPHELSSGQTQLFHLALTLFRPARLLVLDEPEQRLDTDRRMLLADLLRARRDDGTTILLACHDPAVTEAVADAVVDIDPDPR